ncbi:MAG: hypothetical protein A2138_05035 [Deltaproteobacteria bacterium RBG_16_71_12]|nr:MAG: hypothetical protein A2138_05035 [Deltaproteobacteria bacterium RBG_16_71_12]
MGALGGVEHQIGRDGLERTNQGRGRAGADVDARHLVPERAQRAGDLGYRLFTIEFGLGLVVAGLQVVREGDAHGRGPRRRTSC